MNPTSRTSAITVESNSLMSNAAQAEAISQDRLVCANTSFQLDAGIEHRKEERQAILHSTYQRPAQDLKTIIRLPQCAKLLGLSRSTVYLRLNPKSKYYDPNFPKPIQLGMKAVGWKLADVYSYIEKLKYKEADQ